MGHMSRNKDVKDLKKLKAPEEGGSADEYSKFKKCLERHLSASWHGGDVVGQVLTDGEIPVLQTPQDEDTSKMNAFEKSVYDQTVMAYGVQAMLLTENMKAVYSLIEEKFSPGLRETVTCTTGYDDAFKKKDLIWLLATLDDIMTGFTKMKAPLLALDDQLERVIIAPLPTR